MPQNICIYTCQLYSNFAAFYVVCISSLCNASAQRKRESTAQCVLRRKPRQTCSLPQSQIYADCDRVHAAIRSESIVGSCVQQYYTPLRCQLVVMILYVR